MNAAFLGPHRALALPEKTQKIEPDGVRHSLLLHDNNNCLEFLMDFPSGLMHPAVSTFLKTKLYMYIRISDPLGEPEAPSP